MLEFAPEALAEARAAYLWYAEHSHSAAASFINEFDLTLDRIVRTPAAGSPHKRKIRKRRFQRFPYVVVYREITGGIEIIAVAHGSRRPGYWKKRVR